MNNKKVPTPEVGQTWKNECGVKFKITDSHINAQGFEMFHCEYLEKFEYGNRWSMGKGWFDGTSGYSFIK